MARSRKSHSNSTSESLACPRCARRYGLDDRFCAHCGMPLVYAGAPSVEEPESSAHERARKIRPELTRGELVRVAWSRNQAEAELIQNLLLEEGVPSIARRSAGFDVPDFLAAGPRDVLVPESGVETARETLQQADIEPPQSQPARGPSGGHVARVLAAILAGAGATALIAWALTHAA
jgi:pimeloyl-ACP methyl ester carboxylesterase